MIEFPATSLLRPCYNLLQVFKINKHRHSDTLLDPCWIRSSVSRKENFSAARHCYEIYEGNLQSTAFFDVFLRSHKIEQVVTGISFRSLEDNHLQEDLQQ